MGRYPAGPYSLRLIFIFIFVFAALGECGAAEATASIVKVQAVSESIFSQNDVPMTFGQIFREGDVPPGSHLQAKIDGESIPIQVDSKATHGDGSLRHAVITVVVPKLPASATRVVTLSTGGRSATGSPVTLDELLATDFDAHATLTIDGQTYTASARDALEKVRSSGNCKPWNKQCNLWLSGSQVTEWIVSAPLRSSSGANPHLEARFYVRAYAGDPIDRVRVNIAIENDWAWVADPRDIKYDALVKSGSQSCQQKAIDHYTHTRWHCVLWWHKQSKLYAKLDGRYIQTSKAVSQYADVHPDDAFLDTVQTSFPLMSHGNQQEHMGDTGAQTGIGPLPRWTTAYLLSMDQRAFKWMLANDDAAGSYNVFYRDKGTGRPVSLLDYPYMTLKGIYGDTRNPKTGKHEAFPKCGGTCKDPYKPNWAHEPVVGYLSYIVTGDFYYLEQLQFWANWLIVSSNPHYRDQTEGLVKNDQVRGQAWDLRDMANAAYITPNKAPLKDYFVNMVKNNIDWYNKTYTDNPEANKLGAIVNGYAIVYDANSTHSGPQIRLASWQDDFFTWMVGHLVDLGFDGAKRLLDWKAGFVVGRMTAPGFCWDEATSYTLQVRDDEHGAIYSDFATVYDKSFSSDVQNMVCGSQEMADNFYKPGGDRYQPGDMSGYPWSHTGYAANMQPALAAAVDSGITNADVAWSKYETRPTKQDYVNYANFAVVPRKGEPSGAPASPSAPKIDFYADPNPVAIGASTTLHWSAANATTCDGSWMNGQATGGEKKLGPVSGVHTYGIECTGDGGSSSATVKVADKTQRKPTIALKVSPTNVQAGEDAVLTWSTEYADWCTAHGGGLSGDVLLDGQKTVGPLKEDTTFEVDCRGALGDSRKTASVEVEALAPQTEKKEAKQSGDDGGGGAASVLGLILLLGGVGAIRRRNGR